MMQGEVYCSLLAPPLLGKKNGQHPTSGLGHDLHHIGSGIPGGLRSRLVLLSTVLGHLKKGGTPTLLDDQAGWVTFLCGKR